MSALGTTKPSSDLDWMRQRPAPLDRIESELRVLWRSAGPGVTRVQTMTIVAVCETEADVPRAREALGEAAGRHGARTITVSCDSSARDATPQAAAIIAQIALHPSVSRRETPRGEDIVLRASAAARAFIPDTVGKLLTPDVPTYVWWVGDIPDDDDLFDHLAPLSSLVIFDSNDMDLRDLPTLHSMAERDERYFLADFAWNRLRTWQELVARFFDDPERARDLERFDELTIGFRRRDDPNRTPDPISNQAALLLGWVAHVLQWKLERWASEREASFVRRGGKVTVRFEPATDSSAPSGAITSVAMRVAQGDYHVDRDGKDPMVICWSGTCPARPVPSQCLRIHPPTPGRILAHILDHPLRDPLFEASLADTAKLVEPIAPRPTKPGAT